MGSCWTGASKYTSQVGIPTCSTCVVTGCTPHVLWPLRGTWRTGHAAQVFWQRKTVLDSFVQRRIMSSFSGAADQESGRKSPSCSARRVVWRVLSWPGQWQGHPSERANSDVLAMLPCPVFWRRLSRGARNSRSGGFAAAAILCRSTHVVQRRLAHSECLDTGPGWDEALLEDRVAGCSLKAEGPRPQPAGVSTHARIRLWQSMTHCRRGAPRCVILLLLL